MSLPTSVCIHIISLLSLNARKNVFLSFLVLLLSGTTNRGLLSASVVLWPASVCGPKGGASPVVVLGGHQWLSPWAGFLLRMRAGGISSWVSTVLGLLYQVWPRAWGHVGTCHPANIHLLGTRGYSQGHWLWASTTLQVTFWDFFPGIRREGTVLGHPTRQVLPVSHYPVWGWQDCQGKEVLRVCNAKTREDFWRFSLLLFSTPSPQRRFIIAFLQTSLRFAYSTVSPLATLSLQPWGKHAYPDYTFPGPLWPGPLRPHQTLVYIWNSSSRFTSSERDLACIHQNPFEKQTHQQGKWRLLGVVSNPRTMDLNQITRVNSFYFYTVRHSQSFLSSPHLSFHSSFPLRKIC